MNSKEEGGINLVIRGRRMGGEKELFAQGGTGQGRLGSYHLEL